MIEFFAVVPPQSSPGALALARAKADIGHVDEAIAAARELWRNGNFDSWTESLILREFGAPPADLELPEWIHEWRESNALPGARRSAPHVWA